MTTHSQFPQSIFPFGLAARTALGALLAAPWVHAQAQPGFPLLKSCGDTTAVVTTVQSSDPVQIRFSFATDSGTCYAVTATVDGNAVNGYLISGAHWGSETHPAILTFEREMQTHAPVIPPPPPPPPAPPAASPAAAKTAPAPAEKEAPPEAPVPLSFAGFRAVDVQGNRVDLSTQRAPNVVVYFWSALNKRGIQKTEAMENIYEEYHNRGVAVVGIASARNATDLRQVCGENEIVWSAILDSGGIASRYHVDPAKPYLVLDQSRKVIAAVASASDLEQILGPLTQKRRATR